jgi:hypothetical protein
VQAVRDHTAAAAPASPHQPREAEAEARAAAPATSAAEYPTDHSTDQPPGAERAAHASKLPLGTMQHPSSATPPAEPEAEEEGQDGGEHGRWSSAAAGEHSAAWKEAVRTRDIKALPEQASPYPRPSPTPSSPHPAPTNPNLAPTWPSPSPSPYPYP